MGERMEAEMPESEIEDDQPVEHCYKMSRAEAIMEAVTEIVGILAFAALTAFFLYLVVVH